MKQFALIVFLFIIGFSVNGYGQTITKEDIIQMRVKDVRSIAPCVCPMYYPLECGIIFTHVPDYLETIIPTSDSHFQVINANNFGQGLNFVTMDKVTPFCPSIYTMDGRHFILDAFTFNEYAYSNCMDVAYPCQDDCHVFIDYDANTPASNYYKVENVELHKPASEE